jgi:hypothetical protein
LTTDHETFTLDKTIWTQDDYEQMGWHDCSIYGLVFLPVKETHITNLVFDIDYIFKWVNPINPGQPISFWVSPCTLVFKDTFALTMNVDRRNGTTDMLEIADLYLVGKVEQETNKWIYEWSIDLQEGNINFKSIGFDQIVRQKPILTHGQCLTLDEREGVSFTNTPYIL